MGMSGDRPSRQFDVVADTRRRWSEVEKRSVVAEASGVGTNVSAVARRHGIKPSLLFRWKTIYGDIAAPSNSVVPTFVPVALPSPLTPAPISAAPPSCSIEIELAGGRTVRVGSDVDVDALARIVAALEARR